MKKMLITGGTVFVSRYVAEYVVKKGYEVYVLNRNTKPQVKGVALIEADRHQLDDRLRGYHFDAVLDICAYDASDVNDLLDALDSYDDYILISSSAVYPEYGKQPFAEDDKLGENRFWKAYGTDKIAAEQALIQRDDNAYILRPPYLYGAMNNVYREAFVFECAMQDRKFYIPKHGEMKLQFFHVSDLCHFIDILLAQKPSTHVFNVGNPETISILEWVKLCYQVCGKKAEFVFVEKDIESRKYFSFYDYEYELDITKQREWMHHTISMEKGLHWQGI